MAMPQRDDTIEAIKRLDALLQYAVMHNDETERIETACAFANDMPDREKPGCLF